MKYGNKKLSSRDQRILDLILKDAGSPEEQQRIDSELQQLFSELDDRETESMAKKLGDWALICLAAKFIDSRKLRTD